ncbi:MAG TPA: LLM class flavin-dependent oxidoreductase [Streptosporangiaceae bacterium]
MPCSGLRAKSTLTALTAFAEEIAMEVGLGPTIRYHKDRPRPLTEVYDEFLDEFILGDELGYSHIWLPEHHFTYDAHNPSALPILAALARQTSRIRLGTYILLLAFHNPILAAEDAAVVDILSHGRLDLAVGAGPMAQECEVFGVPVKETFGRDLRGAGGHPEVLDRGSVQPPGQVLPVRRRRGENQAGPAAAPVDLHGRLRPAKRHTGRQAGYNLAMGMGPSHGVYVSAVREAGRDPADHGFVSGPIGIHLADTTTEARDEAEEALHTWVSFYVDRGSPVGRGLPPVGELREKNFAFGGMPFMVGSADEVGERMRAMFRRAPLDELVLYFHPPGMATEAARRAMTMFAEQIMPDARDWGVPTG